MPTEQNPYRIADKAKELLNRKAVKRFESTKNQAQIDGFDELEVIQLTRTLYQDLAADNQETFLELAQERYQEVEPHGEEPPDLMWLLALLAAYNAVTKYIYAHEIDRKQQYAAEGINASTAKVSEFRRALRRWTNFTDEYADIVSDETTLKAYKDAGAKKIRWVTAEDERVCGTCSERDGKVYSIDSVPPKPHWGCRCRYVAVLP